MANVEIIRAVAGVFARFGATTSEQDAQRLLDIDEAGSPPSVFFHLLKDLDGRNVSAAAHEAELFRFFVVNGLMLAQTLRHSGRVIVFRAMDAGLRQFAGYFAALDGDGPEGFDAVAEQKRYFAFCIAQLIELGFDMDALLATMKGDTYDQGDSYEVRRLREEGPPAFATSPLFDDHEKALWNAMFESGTAESVAALQQHFVRTYEVPFEPMPTISN